MLRNKIQKKFLIVFIIFLFSSASILATINGKIGEENGQNALIENPKYSGVTIYSLERDPAINDGVKSLEKVLTKYTTVSTKLITNLQKLDYDLSKTSDEYIILFGHSDSETIRFTKELASWNEFTFITSKYKDKTIILPTCYGFSVYQYDKETRENIVAPFKEVVDFRIGVDCALLTLALEFDEPDLLSYSISSLITHKTYLKNPQYTLSPQYEEGIKVEPGEGYFNLYDIYNDYYTIEHFMTEASLRFCIHALIELSLGVLPEVAIVLFLFDLLFEGMNDYNFHYFFDNIIHNRYFDCAYDLGTTTNYRMLYDDFLEPIARLVWGYQSTSISTFDLYSPKYDITSTSYKRKIWRVNMVVYLQQALGIQISYLDMWDFYLFETTTIGWILESYRVVVYNIPPPKPPGGVPLPD